MPVINFLTIFIDKFLKKKIRRSCCRKLFKTGAAQINIYLVTA